MGGEFGLELGQGRKTHTYQPCCVLALLCCRHKRWMDDVVEGEKNVQQEGIDDQEVQGYAHSSRWWDQSSGRRGKEFDEGGGVYRIILYDYINLRVQLE